MSEEAIKVLITSGGAGAVIIVVFFFLKFLKEDRAFRATEREKTRIDLQGLANSCHDSHEKVTTMTVEALKTTQEMQGQTCELMRTTGDTLRGVSDELKQAMAERRLHRERERGAG